MTAVAAALVAVCPPDRVNAVGVLLGWGLLGVCCKQASVALRVVRSGAFVVVGEGVATCAGISVCAGQHPHLKVGFGPAGCGAVERGRDPLRQHDRSLRQMVYWHILQVLPGMAA